ncbi:MAG: 5-formyltetrahydrofolate cyclo-ligase [Actinobacteria bacterium]|nr:5-formyltetrahydrofolate cyclo-ligase [Actinomycetota bacterium]
MQPPRPADPGAAANAVAAAKAAARGRALAARSRLSAGERRRAAARVHALLDGLAELRGARTVLAYAAMRAELDLDAWLRRLLRDRAVVLLPRVHGDRLQVAPVANLAEDLAPGWRGVREPRAGLPTVRPDIVEAAVVPGLAFDPVGRRLGHGGGHFDRLLAELPPAAEVVGVAFDVQLTSRVPTAAHDRCVDLVVTEHRVLHAGRGRSSGLPSDGGTA